MDSTFVPADPGSAGAARLPDDPLFGMTLGTYVFRRRLGAGGMASVYVAYQSTMQREVAIKVIPQQSRDPSFVPRFEREVRVITKLQHVHILPVIDFGSDQG